MLAMNASNLEVNDVKQKKNVYEILKIKFDEQHEKRRSMTHFSRCGKMVATACDRSVRVTRIYSDCTEEILSQSCVFRIEGMKWSPNSDSLLLTSFTECRVEIIRLHDHKWLYQIQDPQECGMVAAMWMPDNKHVLTVSDFSIHSLIHCVSGSSPQALPGIFCPRARHPLLQFSPDGLYMAFVKPSKTGYYVVLLSVISFSILWSVKPECVMISGVLWSPDSVHLAVWDSPRRMCICIFDLNGSCIHALSTLDPASLGVTTLTISHCSHMMASILGDDKIQVFNMLNWHLCAVLTPVDECYIHHAQRNGLFINAPCNTTDSSTSSTCTAMSLIAFSSCGHFLACSMKTSNTHVSVWNIQDGCVLACLLHLKYCVSGLVWNPRKAYLAVADGSNTLAIWSAPSRVKGEASVSIVDTGLDSVASVQWTGKSKVALVSRTGEAAILYLKAYSKT